MAIQHAFGKIQKSTVRAMAAIHKRIKKQQDPPCSVSLCQYVNADTLINVLLILILSVKKKTRTGKDGNEVKYREMKLPISLLKTVYVRKQDTKDNVVSFLQSKGLSIPVKLI